MRIAIVRSDTEFANAVEEAKNAGLRLAAVSNAGLEKGTARLTFLPASAFTDTASGIEAGTAKTEGLGA